MYVGKKSEKSEIVKFLLTSICVKRLSRHLNVLGFILNYPSGKKGYSIIGNEA